ncbi:MAG: transaldolase family protein [Marinisporobacter sp.]|jgi:transaldolase|nr:transaldolase family protein [Marinisporobacter sp.]
MTQYKSPLHEMASTSVTDYWNDSCSISELEYAIENGAVGATTNPVIVGNVLKKEMHLYKDRILELIQQMPKATEDDIAWKINEEMAVAGAKLLQPIFEQTNGEKGRISIQTNTKYYRDVELMVEQAVRFSQLAPNMMVKMPTTKAGVEAIEEATYQGVNINATVSFTVPQAIAVAEAVERGLARRVKEGKDISNMHPVCTIMVGRVDDWLKIVVDRDGIIVDPKCLEWAGVATMKNAYKIFNERGYKTKLLAAAYRNHLQWSEFIGGDMIETIPYKWQKRFNGSDVTIVDRIDDPVDPKIIEELLNKIEDFRKAYNPDGMKVEEFDTFGATSRTLLQFLAGYDDLINIIRNLMITVK